MATYTVNAYTWQCDYCQAHGSTFVKKNLALNDYEGHLEICEGQSQCKCNKETL